MAIIKNRRENIRINEIPPEIYGKDDIEDIVEDVTEGKLVPTGGTNGQVLTKTATGPKWKDVASDGIQFYDASEDLTNLNSKTKEERIAVFNKLVSKLEEGKNLVVANSTLIDGTNYRFNLKNGVLVRVQLSLGTGTFDGEVLIFGENTSTQVCLYEDGDTTKTFEI